MAHSDSIPVPQAAARAFQSYRGITNPGLIFDRFAPDWQIDSTRKKQGLEQVARAQGDDNLLQEWNKRWEAYVQAANGNPFRLKTDWRFIAGLGRKGSLEVGFTFHRYGFPILPGASVKGITRIWALIQIAEMVNASSLKELDNVLSADSDSEQSKNTSDVKGRQKYEKWRAEQSEEVQLLTDKFRAIFGTIAVSGCAVFFDAIPAYRPMLELDIMNPHFPDYYQGNQPPTSWQSPVPVYFLTVAPNTEFRFAVGWRCVLDEEGQFLRNLAQKWLVEGVTRLGAGAKTSAGYGYFVAPQETQEIEQGGRSSSTGQVTQTQRFAPNAPSLSLQALTWRIGTVREYRPEKGFGRLVDDESGKELTFKREAIEDKGWSPGKKHKVRYAVVEQEGKLVVIKIQRA